MAAEIERAEYDIDRFLHGQEGPARAVAKPIIAVAAIGADVIGAVGAEHLAWAAARWKRHFAARGRDLDALKPGRTVGRDFEVEIVVAGEPDLGAAGEIVLEQQRERLGRALLAHLVAQVAVAAFRHGLGDPQRVVELGAERIGRVRRGADAKQRKFCSDVDDRERSTQAVPFQASSAPSSTT